MIAAWAGTYIGLPFRPQGRTRDGCDCWGLVRLVYRECYGIALPCYGAAYDLTRGRAGWPEMSQAIRAGLADWAPVDRGAVQVGDGVVLRVAGEPMHVGIIVGTEPLVMLHIEQGLDSVIEPVEGRIWGTRLAGFFRHAKAT